MTKSLRVYLAQFGLAGEWELEVWREIEDYAALDKVDAWYAEDPDGAKKRDDLWSESAAYFEWGPCGSWGIIRNRLSEDGALRLLAGYFTENRRQVVTALAVSGVAAIMAWMRK